MRIAYALLIVAACGEHADESADAHQEHDADACANPEGGVERSIEAGLPDGKWDGTLAACSPDGSAKQTKLTISSNRVLTEFVLNGFTGTALESYRFLGGGAVEWRGPSDELVGTCTAIGGTLTCMTAAAQTVQGGRVLRFFEDALYIAEQFSVESMTDIHRGVLTRQ